MTAPTPAQPLKPTCYGYCRDVPDRDVLDGRCTVCGHPSEDAPLPAAPTPPPGEMAVPKFVIFGDWLCTQVDNCTCDGGVDMPHRAECGLEPAAPLADVHALLTRQESKFDLAAANEVINQLARKLSDAEEELERLGESTPPSDYCLLPGSHERGCTCGGGQQ